MRLSTFCGLRRDQEQYFSFKICKSGQDEARSVLVGKLEVRQLVMLDFKEIPARKSIKLFSAASAKLIDLVWSKGL
jgi:hypothetical protein